MDEPDRMAETPGDLAEQDEREWDEQIERDVRAGRLDSLINEAIQEHRAGRTLGWPRFSKRGGAAEGGPAGVAPSDLPSLRDPGSSSRATHPELWTIEPRNFRG